VNCQYCHRPRIPAAARWDGEPTAVGFWPCPCTKYDWATGLYVPKTPEDYAREERLKDDYE
jgi:ribosomal protein L37AE/L43A